ncbi:hypothetical protein BpHYR1_051413 [Brachionus plicatilis]|uniref:Uncharacterized protein n=1 Tax=Brachionus plicatilis TaxID=10195 RepID=A0A3M7S213_BRAPC|nr:hypothetical protein BpHYR1_051413 [Brachionus plicatilis]
MKKKKEKNGKDERESKNSMLYGQKLRHALNVFDGRLECFGSGQLIFGKLRNGQHFSQLFKSLVQFKHSSLFAHSGFGSLHPIQNALSFPLCIRLCTHTLIHLTAHLLAGLPQIIATNYQPLGIVQVFNQVIVVSLCETTRKRS